MEEAATSRKAKIRHWQINGKVLEFNEVGKMKSLKLVIILLLCMFMAYPPGLDTLSYGQEIEIRQFAKQIVVVEEQLKRTDAQAARIFKEEAEAVMKTLQKDGLNADILEVLENKEDILGMASDLRENYRERNSRVNENINERNTDPPGGGGGGGGGNGGGGGGFDTRDNDHFYRSDDEGYLFNKNNYNNGTLR